MENMKPKPLDLEKLADEVIRVEYPTYEQTAIPQMKNAIIRKKQQIKWILEHYLKSACEFYLRYKDKPKLLILERPKYKEEVEKMITNLVTEEFMEDYEVLSKYNSWLFKLAFKDVLCDKNESQNT